MFLIWQKFIFLVMLLLPIVATLVFYPDKNIKKISKIAIIICLICITFISPIVILINLRYWSILVILLPIMFRGIEIVINKLNIPTNLSKFNKDFIIQVLIVGIAALVLILITLDFNMWGGFWLSLAVIIFSGTFIIEEIGKYQLLYGVIYGVLGFMITLLLSGEKGIVTYFISWAVCTIPFYYFPIIKKIIKYELIPFVLIPIVSIILMKNGGVSYVWNKFYAAAFLIIVVHIILLPIYFIFEKLNKNKVNSLFKQYYLSIILIVVEFVLIYYKNKFKDFEYIVSIPLIVIGAETLIINLGRFTCPIVYKLQNKQTFIKVNDISDIFLLTFGKKIGEFLYKIVIGEYYDKLNTIEVGIGTIVSIISPLFGILLVSKNISINSFVLMVFSDSPINNMLAILFMTMSGMTIFDCTIRLFYHNRYSIGIEEKNARDISSTLSINYLFLAIYYIYLFLPSIDKINIYVKVIAILWLATTSLGICMSLSTDLVKPRYNTLKYTRYRMSVLLYGTSVFITFYSVLTDSLQLVNTNSIIDIFSKYYYIVVVCTFLCKLVGFDTSIASQKMKSKHIRDSIKLALLITFAGLPLILFGGIILRLSKSITLARFFINLMYLSLMLNFTKSLIIAIIPSKNNIEESEIEYLSFKRIRTEARKNKIKNKKIKNK